MVYYLAMMNPEKFYHFKQGHYFYFDGSEMAKNIKMVIILDVNLTKFVFTIPVDLIKKALQENDL